MRVRHLVAVTCIAASTLVTLSGAGAAVGSSSPPTTPDAPATLQVSLPDAYTAEMLHARWTAAPDAQSCVLSSNLDDAPDVAVASAEDHHRLGPVTASPGAPGFVSVTCQVNGEASTLTAPVTVTATPALPPRRVGTFDTSCIFRVGASLHDDPIVFPNLPGASHLHDFFGTRGTNANSTGESLLAEGRLDLAEDGVAGCKDLRDHAAYWSPALWRSSDGGQTWVRMFPVNKAANFAAALHVYYRGNAKTVSFPVGLGMVSMNAGWACGDQQAQSFVEPVNCFDEGKPVTMIVKFPHCWDGVHLTSTDKSHVSNANDCARTDGPDPGLEPDYPIDIPRLTFAGISYGKINNDNPPVQYQWRLGPNPDGSYNPTSTAHADFLNAWDPFRMDQSVHQCIRTGSIGPELTKLCHDDGRP